MERGFNPVVPVLGAMLGFFASRYFLTIDQLNEANKEADKRVAAVQEINAQLSDQLSDSYEISGLVVDDEGSSFEFTSVLPGSGRELCTGNFEIVDDVARGVGNIACTTETEIPVQKG